MASSEIELTCMKRLQDDSNCDPRMENILRSLKLIISNPVSFSRCNLWWEIERKLFKPRLLKPTAFAFGIEDTRIRRSFEDIRVSEPTTVKMVLSDLEKLRLIKMETENFFSAISESSLDTIFYEYGFIILTEDKTEVDFVHSLLGILKDVLGCEADAIIPVKEQIETLEEKLRFLRNFMCFLHGHGSTRRIFSFAKAVAVNTVCLLHFWLVDEKNNEDKIREVKAGISFLVEKINPLRTDLIDIYIHELKFSNYYIDDISLLDEYGLAFYDSLIDNLKELLNNQTSSMVAEDKEIEVLFKEFVVFVLT